MTDVFGRVGIWISRRDDPAERETVAGAAYAQGYGTVWLSGGLAPGVFDDVRMLLASSDDRLKVGTSVLNIWMETPDDCRAAFAGLEETFPGRFYLGLGVSHAPAIEGAGVGVYRRPLRLMTDYLEGLRSGLDAIPGERILIGALGPRMLELAKERTLGTLPYLVGVDHVAAARQRLEGGPVVAPELTVAVHDDLATARDAARAHLATYLELPNYTNNFERVGFGPDHLRGGGSDELVDAIYALGEVQSVHRRVAAMHDAGADHVALQVVPGLGRTLTEAIALLGPGTVDMGKSTN